MVDFWWSPRSRVFRALDILHRSRHVLLELVIPDQDGVFGVSHHFQLHDPQTSGLSPMGAWRGSARCVRLANPLGVSYLWRDLHCRHPYRLDLAAYALIVPHLARKFGAVLQPAQFGIRLSDRAGAPSFGDLAVRRNDRRDRSTLAGVGALGQLDRGCSYSIALAKTHWFSARRDLRILALLFQSRRVLLQRLLSDQGPAVHSRGDPRVGFSPTRIWQSGGTRSSDSAAACEAGCITVHLSVAGNSMRGKGNWLCCGQTGHALSIMPLRLTCRRCHPGSIC